MKTAQEILSKLTLESAPITVHDLAMIEGKPQRRHEYASLTGRMQKLVGPGGDYNHLLGKVIFPSDYKRGPKVARWCEGIEPMKDKIARTEWQNTTDMVVMKQELTNLGVVLSDKDRKAIATLGKTSYLAVMSLHNSLAAIANEERIVRADLEERFEAFKAAAKDEIRVMIASERGNQQPPAAAN